MSLKSKAIHSSNNIVNKHNLSTCLPTSRSRSREFWNLQGIARKRAWKCIISISTMSKAAKGTMQRAKINKEHKRKWPDNACCTIANKASTARQRHGEWERKTCIEGSLLIEICLQFLFSLNFSNHTHMRSDSLEIHLTCFDWSIRYTAPVFVLLRFSPRWQCLRKKSKSRGL